jgi:phage/plasmid-associated DNA primase
MKLVDFESKFRDEDEVYNDEPKYVFPKDKDLKEKLPNFAPVFISMLIQIACETNGIVKDCQEVVAASNKYRQSQDCITGFIIDRIVKDANGSIGKKILNDVFKEWFQMNYGNEV